MTTDSKLYIWKRRASLQDCTQQHFMLLTYMSAWCRHVGGDLDLNAADQLTDSESFTSTRLIANAPSRSPNHSPFFCG